VLSEDQCVETVFVVDLALYPRTASGWGSIADLGDRQIEVVLGHLLVSVLWFVNRFRVNTHEPFGLNRIKPDSKGIRILFFGAYLRSEMLGELCCSGLHISQLVEETFHGRWVGSVEDRHLFYRCTQVADGLERSSVSAEELGRGQSWSVGHDWHRVGPVLGWNETAFGMHTHEPCGLNGIKPIPAAFSSLFPCFSESPNLAHVRLCRVRIYVASLGGGRRKNATRLMCRVVLAIQRVACIRSSSELTLGLLVGDAEILAQALERSCHLSQGEALVLVETEVFIMWIWELVNPFLDRGQLVLNLGPVVVVRFVLLWCVTGHLLHQNHSSALGMPSTRPVASKGVRRAQDRRR